MMIVFVICIRYLMLFLYCTGNRSQEIGRAIVLVLNDP